MVEKIKYHGVDGFFMTCEEKEELDRIDKENKSLIRQVMRRVGL